jgi:thiol:disulfide interchange protein DsbD
VQADVTANDEVDQALLARFAIFGPPTIVFYDRQGSEIENQRVIGYMKVDDFLSHLDYVLR